MTRPIIVQRCPSKQTCCNKCGYRIGLGSLRVFSHCILGKTKYFHLRCFVPYKPRPVMLDREVILPKQASETEIGKIQKWVEKWNSKFVVTVDKVPLKFVCKSVHTTESGAKRLLIEVFRYLSAPETELVAAVVCKSWFHVTREEELWRHSYNRDFSQCTDARDCSHRTQYIAEVLNRCWACSKVVHLSEIKLICPLRKRPLCESCNRKDAGEFLTFSTCCRQRCLSAKLIRELEFPVFKYDRIIAVYQCDFSRLFVPYAEKRRKLLLSCLERPYDVSQSVLDEIRGMDIPQMCKGYVQCKGTTKAMLTFCGKSEKGENLLESVEEFVEKVRQIEENNLRIR